MRKLLLALALISTPAVAATSSADLEAIAKVLEQTTVPSATLNTQLLSLLREPAKTLDGITLPSTAAQYTTTIDTALKPQAASTAPRTLAGGLTAFRSLAFAWKRSLGARATVRPFCPLPKLGPGRISSGKSADRLFRRLVR
jgi:hypothetical protein